MDIENMLTYVEQDLSAVRTMLDDIICYGESISGDNSLRIHAVEDVIMHAEALLNEITRQVVEKY